MLIIFEQIFSYCIHLITIFCFADTHIIEWCISYLMYRTTDIYLGETDRILFSAKLS